jgi:hypothetical protein
VKPEVLDPWFLAGTLSSAANARVAGRVSTTNAGALRIDLKRLTVPVLPIETQRIYGDAFRRLAVFEAALNRVVNEGAALAHDLIEGLTSGALAPNLNPATEPTS